MLGEVWPKTDEGRSDVVDATEDPPRARHKRKATGARRKEEIEVLKQEVKALQAQVTLLQKDAEREASVKSSELEQDIQETNFIRQAVLQQQVALVNVQSALSKLTMMEPRAPHATSICLGTDLKERWATLIEMKSVKIQDAMHHLRERGRFVDDTDASSYATRFKEQDDSFFGEVYDVVPFEGVSSVKLVFDALHYYFSNMEIRVTESLGDITIREDDGSSEPGISQCRFVSYLSSGPLLEMNSVICSEFMEVDDEYGDGGAVGIFTEDFVDQDDLYPYVPDKRVRMDASVVTQVRAHTKRSKNLKGVEEEKSIVVMQRWAHCRIHKPNMALSPEVIDEIREKSSHWGDVKLDAVREMVYRLNRETHP